MVDSRVVFLIAAVAAFSGCASPYASDRLAATGALAGAGIGAVIGAATGEPAAGAVIGGALGTVTGAAVGSELDAQEARNQAYIEQRLGRQMAGAVQIHDVIAMSQCGLSNEVIITHVQAVGVAQPLTPQDLIVMKQNGVSDVVMNAMQQPPQVALAQPPPPPVIIEEHVWAPPPPPPWHHRHCRSPRSRVSWGVSFGL